MATNNIFSDFGVKPLERHVTDNLSLAYVLNLCCLVVNLAIHYHFTFSFLTFSSNIIKRDTVSGSSASAVDISRTLFSDDGGGGGAIDFNLDIFWQLYFQLFRKDILKKLH